MRPIKLVMSGFGPYAGKTVLDLDKLGDRGLYLVAGETGAGKTTIFDAISFALFGEPSGEVRERSMLRSKFAAPDMPTEVELTFLYAGKTYVIRRNPQYERPKAYGTGMTTQQASASLILPNGDIVDKSTRDVDAAIKNLLGLDKDQFSRIAMIAQGEFQKLIVAETKDRQEIFRSLFHTDLYEKFQKRVREDDLALNKKLAETSRAIDQYASGIRLPEDYGELPPTNEEKITALGEILQNDEKQLSELRTGLTSIETKISELTAAETKAAQDEENRRALASAETVIAALVEKQKKLSEAAEREKAREPELEKLTKALHDIEAELKKYAAVEEKDREAAEARRESDKAAKKETESAAKREKLQAQLQKERDEYNALENAGSELEKLRSELDKLKTREGNIRDYEKAVKDAADKRRQADAAREKYTRAQENAETAQNEAQRLRSRFNDEQAGVLARTLCDGEPCPVCGSRVHPHPAICSEEAPSEQAVKRAEKDALDAQKLANDASQASGTAKGAADSAEATAKEKKTGLFGEAEIDINEEKAKVREAIRSTESSIFSAETNVKRRTVLSGTIQKTEADLSETEKAYANAKAEHAAAAERSDALRKQTDALRAECSYASAAEAKKEKERIESACGEIRTAQKKTQEDLQKAVSDLAGEEGKAEQLKKLLEGVKPQDPEAIRTQKKEHTQKKQALQDEIESLRSRIDANEAAKKGMESMLSTFQTDEARCRWMDSLYTTVSGNMFGKDRVTLETYVQITYFERILGRANVHFMRMSGNKYELKRKETAADHVALSGLELDVIDHYNGSERSVKSLSGGEKFLASLSLALGLSEEIQESAGGIHLDSLFVDEGFGSLDEETLRLAMRALQDMADGNRLIGIISHVGELQQRIDRQIVVTRNPDGTSRAEIIRE